MEPIMFNDWGLEDTSRALGLNDIPEPSGRGSLSKNEVFLWIAANPRLTPAAERKFTEAPEAWVDLVCLGEASSSEVVTRLNEVAAGDVG